MSQEQHVSYGIDGSDLAKSAVTGIRVALGLAGLAALIIGLLISFAPTRTAVALAWLLGLYWIIAGVVYVAVGIFARGARTGSRVLDVVLGLLMLFAGITVMSSPSESAVFLGIFLGIYVGVLWLIEGVVAIVQSGSAPSRGWSIFFGILSVLAGIALFTSPLWGVQVLFFWTGILLIVLGVMQVIRAFTFGKALTDAA